MINLKLLFCFVAGVLSITLNAQTPTLQQVTTAGNTTTTNISAAAITGSADAKFNGASVGRGTGSGNASSIILGDSALSKNTTGTYNSAIGSHALNNNTTGGFNNAFGAYSLYNNVSGNSNTGVGYSSLGKNTTAHYNTAVGASALYYNTTGASNTGVGYWSLINNTTGSDNAAIGVTALRYNTTGIRNTAIGREALYNNLTGSYNVGIGYNAAPNDNTSDGQLSIQNIIFGVNNTGYGATISTGKIGIGIKVPTEKLDVNGNVKATGLVITTNAGIGKILTSDSTGTATWQTPTASASNWTLSTSGSNIYNTNSGNIGLGTQTPDSNAKLDVNGNIFSNGKIVIGETNMSKVGDYSLAVNGSALFTKAVVKLNPDWPDYVFDKEYKLPTLEEIEKYIQLHQHLPEVPSAQEVEKNGIDLGGNQTVLLKKIEELTLFIIEQNKQLESQNKRIQDLEKKASTHK